MKHFISGFKGMLPITTGVIPFALVMGTIFSEAGLTLFQSMMMNVFVFAGASQIATIDLMLSDTDLFIVVLTGLIINLRFILYSAALSPVVTNSHFLVKLFAAFFVTDQNYAVMSAHESRNKETNNNHLIKFYFGASLCMILAWHSGVMCGYLLGNLAPATWNLDYAIPLSFIALIMPSLKNQKYIFVALCSCLLSLILYKLPFNLGLIVSALVSITFASFLTRRG